MANVPRTAAIMGMLSGGGGWQDKPATKNKRATVAARAIVWTWHGHNKKEICKRR